LPAASLDLAFVCDTYHHFAYPEKSLASIHRALKPQGALIVIDFEREVGKSREWVLQHVRAGKDVFTEEILRSGFEMEAEVPIEGFHENYLVRFVKRN
jgi:predicted methyltransferase